MSDNNRAVATSSRRSPEAPSAVHPPRPQRPYNYYVLQSESSGFSGDSSESPMSIQALETDIARDTSDLETPSEPSSFIEYGVISAESVELSEDRPRRVVDGDSSGDLVDIGKISKAVFSPENCGGDSICAGSEESTAPVESTDNRPKLSLYGYCSQCQNTNDNPMVRFCAKCYKVRKTFFPSRPKREWPKACTKKRKRTSEATLISEEIAQELTDEKHSVHLEDGDDIDDDSTKRIKLDGCEDASPADSILTPIDHAASFGRSACEEAQTVPSPELPDDPAAAGCRLLGIDDPNLLTEDRSSDIKNDIETRVALLAGPGNRDRDPVKRSESGKCIACLVQPQTGVFVHGRIAHICCCYKCSIKVWLKTKRCPLCNCKISNVLKAFSM